MDITVNEAQRRLALIWGVGAAVEFVLLIWEKHIRSRFSDLQRVSDAWQWFLPLITPFLTFNTHVRFVARSVQSKTNRKPNLAISLFRLANWLSIAYLFGHRA